MKNELLENIDKLHTTNLGIGRIRRNLHLEDRDVVSWCKDRIKDEKTYIQRQGKNWYVYNDDCIIKVNASSYTIITAHKK